VDIGDGPWDRPDRDIALIAGVSGNAAAAAKALARTITDIDPGQPALGYSHVPTTRATRLDPIVGARRCYSRVVLSYDTRASNAFRAADFKIGRHRRITP